MRRLRWILWLMLALLPWRGWAFAAMPMPGAALPPAAVVAPCHEAAAPVDGVAGEPAAAAQDAAPNCTLCEFCHSVAAPAASGALRAPASAPADLPLWRSHAAADAERQALFKPPRD